LLGLLVKDLQVFHKKIFEVHNLLLDPFLGFAWVEERQTKVELKLGCWEHKIDGCFKHRNCPWIFNFGEPFINLTCDASFQIPQELDFRKKVVL